jgi:pyruvate dehydrogenase E2 component (dihydrolipoamide acetyltransferase)
MPIEIRMPRLVDTMTQGAVVAWRKKEGQQVRAGEVIAEIEADKATVDLEAPGDGTLARIIVPVGAGKVEVGSVLAVLDEIGRMAPASNDQPSAVPPPVSVADGDEVQPAQPAVAITALARSMARQAGLEVFSLQGSGPQGRVVLADVIEALGPRPNSAAAPAPAAAAARAQETSHGDAPYVEIPHSRIRQVIAGRLGESKRTIPHFYLEASCRVDALLRVRAEVAGWSVGGLKLSINDFAIRAAALALRNVPEANASWTDSAARRYRQIDLAFAVATESGLVAPVVRDADRKGLAELATEVDDLARRAREGQLRLDELQGGTFTVSNLGMYGVDAIYAIINPPQAGIVGLGAAAPRPVAVDGSVVIATMMTCTLSADHRVLDGVTGARFLSAFKGFIEQPLTMIL